MLNKLSIINIKDEVYPETTYSGIAIDDVQLDEWLAEFIDDPTQELNVTTIRGLWLSLNLDLDADTKLVWQYLGQLSEAAISYVPLLVCPDDVDLSCTVVVAEQQVVDDKVVWRRFGFLLGDLEQQSSNTIKWFNNVPKLMFSRDNFVQVFTTLLKEFTSNYNNSDQFSDIKFPTYSNTFMNEN